MSDFASINNKNPSPITHEPEDGEIEEINANTLETNGNVKEIEDYYSKLKNLGSELRCSCCGEVYSDPVKLKCDHLIDRCCISNKIKGKVITCFICQIDTFCDDIDDLLTDFDIASQIPPKPNSLINLINKNGNYSPKLKKLKLEDKTINNDDGKDNMINGVKVIKERTQRRKKSRWSAIDENKTDLPDCQSVIVDPQTTFSGVISNMLASNNGPKNITLSKFKQYTELSSKAEIMNLLTEVVMQNSKVDSQNHEKKSQSLSDKDILEMIPVNELEDLFDLEKIQLIFLYREALDKGVLMLPSQQKSPGLSSKTALLPTPKPSSNGSVESHGKSSPTSSRKRYTSESSKSSNISCPSSINSMLDSSDSESLNDNRNRSHKKSKHRKAMIKAIISENSTKKLNQIPITSESTISAVIEPIKTKIVTSCNSNNNSNINTNRNTNPSYTNDNTQISPITNKPNTNDCQKICDNIRYREDINRLHALYSIMYHASLKMKEFENKIEGEEYQSSYKTYCDTYTEYQQLYSSLQSVINIDAISADKPDSISNSYTGSGIATPLVNGVNITAVCAPHQEQASSTISPAFYAPDSTDSIADNKNTKITQYPQTNNDIKTNIQNNLSNYHQFKKETSIEAKNKFGYLWISNLSKDIRTNELCKLFGKFGHISKVKLFQYKAQIPPSYFGLVFMPNYNEAENALKLMQNKVVNDRQIQIKMLENNPISDDRI